MKCDQCNKKLEKTYFTAIGMKICEECNNKNGGTISLDFVVDHIIKHGDVAESG
jgi:hypothetical protein